MKEAFYHLEPDAGAGVDGRPEDVHLAQQGGGRGGVVLGGAGRDQVGGPSLLASLVVFRGVLAVEVRQCLLYWLRTNTLEVVQAVSVKCSDSLKV